MGQSRLAGVELHIDLTGARGLETANLIGARYDALTRWPAGFEPQQHGAILLR